jgi:hypothetical protein
MGSFVLSILKVLFLFFYVGKKSIEPWNFSWVQHGISQFKLFVVPILFLIGKAKQNNHCFP